LRKAKEGNVNRRLIFNKKKGKKGKKVGGELILGKKKRTDCF